MKKCSKCKKLKRKSSFYVDNSRPDKLRPSCKPCTIEVNYASRLRNPEKHRQSGRRWKKRHPEKHIENHLMYKFGITYAQFNQLSDFQNQVCAICEQPCRTHARLSVDHCHLTGRIRGLLCNQCNHMLGNAKDSPELLRKAAEYLENAVNTNKQTKHNNEHIIR